MFSSWAAMRLGRREEQNLADIFQSPPQDNLYVFIVGSFIISSRLTIKFFLSGRVGSK